MSYLKVSHTFEVKELRYPDEIIPVIEGESYQVSLRNFKQEYNNKRRFCLEISVTQELEITPRQEKKLELISGNTIDLNETTGAIRNIFEEQIETVSGRVNDFFKTLRWRMGKEEGFPSYVFHRYWWKFEKSDSWNKVMPISEKSRVYKVRSLQFDSKNDYSYFLGETYHYSEPIAHDLIREALSIYKNSHRAAMVIGFTALEVGSKNFMGKKLPDSLWFFEEMPSPNIHKIIKEFLPSIELNFKLNSQFLAEIKNMMNIRNDLVHKGVLRLDPNKIHHYLIVIKDILYIYDYFLGQKWALDLIDNKNIINLR